MGRVGDLVSRFVGFGGGLAFLGFGLLGGLGALVDESHEKRA